MTSDLGTQAVDQAAEVARGVLAHHGLQRLRGQNLM